VSNAGKDIKTATYIYLIRYFLVKYYATIVVLRSWFWVHLRPPLFHWARNFTLIA